MDNNLNVVKPSKDAVKIPIKESETYLTAEITKLSLQLSKEILCSYITGNRPSKKQKQATYVKDMINNKWPLTGQPIIFDEDGHCIDGMNRCEARVDADLDAEDPLVLLIWGIKADVFPYMDLGSPRTGGDAIAIAGIETVNQNVHASVLRMLKADEEGGTPKAVHLHTLVEFAKKHPSLADSIRYTQEKEFVRHLLSPTLAAYTRYKTSSIDLDKSDSFFDALENGANLTTNDVRYLLRERLLKMKNAKTLLKDPEKRALVIKAWNCHLKNETCKLLRYRSKDSPQGVESMPTWAHQ